MEALRLEVEEMLEAIQQYNEEGQSINSDVFTLREKLLNSGLDVEDLVQNLDSAWRQQDGGRRKSKSKSKKSKKSKSKKSKKSRK